jgi:hypothetical protein
VLLSVAGHGAAGGQLPGPGPVLLVTAAFSLLCPALTTRRRNFSSLLGVLLLTQFFAHPLFVVLAGHHSSAMIGVNPAMLAGHLLAAALCALLLAHGEDLVWRHCALVASLLFAALLPRFVILPAAAGISRVLFRSTVGVHPWPGIPVLRFAPRRGPPLTVCP